VYGEGPFCINGEYPLFKTAAAAHVVSPFNSSHTMLYSGRYTTHMPNGLTEGHFYMGSVTTCPSGIPDVTTQFAVHPPSSPPATATPTAAPTVTAQTSSPLPLAPTVSSSTVRAIMTAAGDVSDYNSTTRTAIAQAFAALLSISVQDITVSITSASVSIQVDMKVVQTSTSTVQATVTEAIGTATKATQFLSSVSVIITIAPVVTALDASEHDGVDAGVMTGAIGGPLFGLLGIGGYVYYTQTKRGGQNVAVTAKPDV